jgi:MFS family permease
MQSFGAAFPKVYADDSFRGWFVSTLLLAAWFWSLFNGPVADRLGRKLSMIVAVAIFLPSDENLAKLDGRDSSERLHK